MILVDIDDSDQSASNATTSVRLVGPSAGLYGVYGCAATDDKERRVSGALQGVAPQYTQGRPCGRSQLDRVRGHEEADGRVSGGERALVADFGAMDHAEDSVSGRVAARGRPVAVGPGGALPVSGEKRDRR